ncbi:TetR/AcrR family transcriptional regulator [Tumebacillus sp. ITR2]|uniref:TetR/AcrR family transcriptional regulator n=1 Tax=Tumebacillus amylolyticus TaxID=2801339 RepID=A0ABS1JG11_9BACL|nr:TetR/AcrR family transcriptional regulator [Tumebacillus amylolyticus]MBL0389216.1 TetR/AcrR family transcriptional regulator [Tumebacillus amylolyticus]
MDKQSLRIVKREATAHALADAAFGLAQERGLDGFVVEDVVQIAGYSRRTFANHYSCKEEAVAAAVFPYHGLDEVAEVLEGLPQTSTPLDIMYHFMKMQHSAVIFRKMRQLTSLAKQYPTLEPFLLSVHRRMQTSSQQMLSDLFQDRYPLEYTHLLAGAVYAIVLPLLDGSLNVLLPDQPPEERPGATPFDQFVDTTFQYLRNGF